MDLEQLRNNWQKAHLNIKYLENDNRKLAEKLAAGRARTARNKLSLYYRRSALVAIILPVISPLLVYVLGFPQWVAYIYALFGVVMAAVNLWFSIYITRCDYTSMPVVTALANAVKIARYQRYIRSFGVSTGGMLIVTMFVNAFDHSEYHIIVAFIVGSIAGAIIGIKKFRRMSELARKMQDELKSALHD